MEGGDESGDCAEDRREEHGRDAPCQSVSSNRTVPDDRPASVATWTTTAPRASPITPPMNPMSAASMTSSRTMRKRLPPIARLMPISRVRSAIDMAIVLMTDRPPTTRLISAIPTRIELRIAVADPICLSKSLPVIAVTVGTCASIRSASTSGSTPSAGNTTIDVMRSLAVEPSPDRGRQASTAGAPGRP